MQPADWEKFPSFQPFSKDLICAHKKGEGWSTQMAFRGGVSKTGRWPHRYFCIPPECIWFGAAKWSFFFFLKSMCKQQTLNTIPLLSCSLVWDRFPIYKKKVVFFSSLLIYLWRGSNGPLKSKEPPIEQRWGVVMPVCSYQWAIQPYAIEQYTSQGVGNYGNSTLFITFYNGVYYGLLRILRTFFQPPCP
jgi:hypothetical protein